MSGSKANSVGAYGDTHSRSDVRFPPANPSSGRRADRRTPLRITRRADLRLTAGVLAGAMASRMPSPAWAQPAFPGNVDPPLLVDPTWLQAEAEANIRVLDCSPLRTYEDAHIPGAIHAWWQDTMDPNKPTYGSVLGPGNKRPDGT